MPSGCHGVGSLVVVRLPACSIGGYSTVGVHWFIQEACWHSSRGMERLVIPRCIQHEQGRARGRETEGGEERERERERGREGERDCAGGAQHARTQAKAREQEKLQERDIERQKAKEGKRTRQENCEEREHLNLRRTQYHCRRHPSSRRQTEERQTPTTTHAHPRTHEHHMHAQRLMSTCRRVFLAVTPTPLIRTRTHDACTRTSHVSKAGLVTLKHR